MTYVQLFSMLFSLFTLTINASRAFFIQRGKDEADPDPNIHMILKVFPYMLMQVGALLLQAYSCITTYSSLFYGVKLKIWPSSIESSTRILFVTYKNILYQKYNELPY